MISPISAQLNCISKSVLRLAAAMLVAAAFTPAQAAYVSFSGQLDLVATDEGGGVYSGVTIGTDFSGVINDETFNGHITDGTRLTTFGCCIGELAGLTLLNDETIDAQFAFGLNAIAGTSFQAGDMIDAVVLEGGRAKEGDGEISITIAWIFDADAFDADSQDFYPPNSNDALARLFFIFESGRFGSDVYNGIGVIDEISISDLAFEINPGLNDAWFNSATAGQGFLLVVFPDQGIVFLAWFTYDTERPPQNVAALLGEPGHRWVTAQGPFDGDTATLTVYLTEGGVFDAADPPAVTNVDEPIGTITIQWHDCEHATLTYEIDPPGVMGQIELTRIVPDNVDLCDALQGL